MATETMNHRISEPSAFAVQPELLVSSVLHLMSHYTAQKDQQGCKNLAAVIERHLDTLAEVPELTPVLRATCRQLAGEWADVVERAVPVPQKQHRFLRFVAGGR